MSLLCRMMKTPVKYLQCSIGIYNLRKENNKSKMFAMLFKVNI